MTNEPREATNDKSQSPEWEALAHEQGDRDFLSRLDAVAAIIRERDANSVDAQTALAQVKLRRSKEHKQAGRILPFAATGRARWNIAALAIAAAALIAIGLPYYRERIGRSLSETGIHSIGHHVLPDGTKVTLAPMSSLSTSGNFESGNRTVEVSGEVFFEVAHDAAHPFTVRAGSVVVQDVGTKFSVTTQDSAVVVAVTEGEVVLSQGGAASVALQAGDRAHAARNGPTTVEKNSVTENDVAWTHGTLVFRDAPLSEVSDKVWRWYRIHLVVTDAALASRHLTAAFSTDSSNTVLEVIRMALGAEIETKGDSAFVRSAKGMRH